MIRLTLNRALFLASIAIVVLGIVFTHGWLLTAANITADGLVCLVGMRIIIALRRGHRATLVAPQDAPETLPVP